jgi:hypothetical protein
VSNAAPGSAGRVRLAIVMASDDSASAIAALDQVPQLILLPRADIQRLSVQRDAQPAVGAAGPASVRQQYALPPSRLRGSTLAQRSAPGELRLCSSAESGTAARRAAISTYTLATYTLCPQLLLRHRPPRRRQPVAATATRTLTMTTLVSGREAAADRLAWACMERSRATSSPRAAPCQQVIHCWDWRH